jgi:hypothetical protein
MRHEPKPTAAIPASEPPAPEEPAPKEPALEANATLPEARASGEEQVEATDAAPADGTGKCLTAHG